MSAHARRPCFHYTPTSIASSSTPTPTTTGSSTASDSLSPLSTTVTNIASSSPSTSMTTGSSIASSSPSTPTTTGSSTASDSSSPLSTTGTSIAASSTSTPTTTGSSTASNSSSSPTTSRTSTASVSTSTPITTVSSTASDSSSTSTPTRTSIASSSGLSTAHSNPILTVSTGTHITSSHTGTPGMEVKPSGSLKPWEIFLITLASVVMVTGLCAGLFIYMRRYLSLRNAVDGIFYNPNSHLGPGGSHMTRGPTSSWRRPVVTSEVIEMNGL
ncbi:LOW QUALITY PROTEIN: mucin-21-like [Rattus rattus]|uniref:LOW QUALITY PROTEIN: mucin-21-like n=1 Tax=Rattus rattus TaxID=10117 RepID=UPI0013F37D1F|nr:LOW QUALITY PROTEIN: mucin-21-like [Rattus rattus]